ncbi:hypothetical protein [Herbaspirillum rubrisubalbicans]|uniref:hypothetical protein n=1 Tax=Herbaspirillum rubrisubalbicans TaxID=80842 RepID=UPI00073A0EB1|nr:hypothetical protein [Herbaspirillum rubrisubalbicans]
MEVKIVQSPDDAALHLNATDLKRFNLVPGQMVIVDFQPHGVMLRALPKRARYGLADLVGQCDPTAPEPLDMGTWANLRAVGRETS